VRRTLAALGPPLAVVAAALLAWQGAVSILRPPEYLVPGPIAITRAFLDDAARLTGAMLRTGLAAATGFALAAAVGVTLGSLFAASPFLRRGVYPLASLLQMVPLVALAPILVIWFGYGFTANVTIAILVAFFPVVLNTTTGLDAVDDDHTSRDRIGMCIPENQSWFPVASDRLPAFSPD